MAASLLPLRRHGHRLRGAALAAVGVLLQSVCCAAWGWGSGWGSTPTDKKHATDELVGDSFEPFIKENPVTAVLFYAPWCFYSQQVMPAWDMAGQKLKLHDPPVEVVKIDAHRYGSVGDKYGINAFPMIKLFVDGTVFEYDAGQGRGWQQIVKWVNRHTDRDHLLKNVEDLDHYLHDNDLNVVGLFPDGHDNDTFIKASRHFEDVMFAEARGTETAGDIAKYLSRHATFVCESVDVGASEHANSKEVELPRAGMHCTGAPRNPQRPEWGDTFAATVVGTKLAVKRTDHDSDGWQQHLQLKCCDDEDTAGKSDENRKIHEISVPSIVMFMPHDERFAKYDGNPNDFHELSRWISARRAPMVMQLSMATAEKILETGPDRIPVLFLIQNGHATSIEKVVREAASQLRGRVTVCLSGISSPIEKRLADLAGVDEEAIPVVVLIEAHGSGAQGYQNARKFRLDNIPGATPNSVVKFIEDYENSRLKPWLKSEPVPSKEESLGNPVGILVGQTFTDAAHDTAKDVLVNFYAPWCGHCRKFEPSYKDLAKRLKHVKSLRITKIDATRNEVEGMTIMGFPTVVLFPAGEPEKRQVHYQGNREAGEMGRWLKENCAIRFDERPPKEAVMAEAPVSGLLDPSEEDL